MYDREMSSCSAVVGGSSSATCDPHHQQQAHILESIIWGSYAVYMMSTLRTPVVPSDKKNLNSKTDTILFYRRSTVVRKKRTQNVKFAGEPSVFFQTFVQIKMMMIHTFSIRHWTADVPPAGEVCFVPLFIAGST